MIGWNDAKFWENVQLTIFVVTLALLGFLYGQSRWFFGVIRALVGGRAGGPPPPTAGPGPTAPTPVVPVIGVREGLPPPEPPPVTLARLLWLSLSGNKLLAAELALVLLIAYGRAFAQNGLPALFWAESAVGQGVAGLSVTLFVCLIFYTIFIVDDDVKASFLRLLEDHGDVVPVRGLWCYLASMTLPFIVLTILPGFLPAFRPEGDPCLHLVVAWPWLLGVASGLLIVDIVGRFRVFSNVYWAVLRVRGVTRKRREEFLQDRRDAYGFANTFNLLGVIATIYAVAFGARLAGLAYQNAPFLICLFLGVIATLYAFLISNHRRYQLATIAVLIYGILANSNPYKNRFPGLDAYYERPDVAKVSLMDGLAGPDPRPESEVVLARWHAEVGRPAAGADLAAGPPVPGQKPKLAIVAVSGGAIRAATWAAVVLTELEKTLPDFRRRLRLITGASGGMLGAALYTTTLREFDEPGDTPRRHDYRARHGSIVDDLSGVVRGDSFEPHDFLTPVVDRMVLSDLPSIFSLRDQRQDRGSALEDAWAAHTGGALSVPFSALRAPEEAGQVPSLVFSPMMVEDGRRLLIGNLKLDEFTRNLGMLAGDPAPAGGAAPAIDQVSSRSAIEFFRLFDAPGFQVATAVRMNASFPYISPATSLPTRPTRRVVDAGYYDNYGVDLAAAWILRNAEWIADHTSGVVLIQVRAFPDPDDLSDPDQPVARAPGAEGRPGVAGPRPSALDWLSGRVSAGAQFLTSPIDGFASARSAVNNYRNDEQVEVVSEWFRNHLTSPEFFANVVFTCDESRPPAASGLPAGPTTQVAAHAAEHRAEDSIRGETLSWTIGKVEKIQIAGGKLPCASVATPGAMRLLPNSSRLENLKAWWRDDHETEPDGVKSGLRRKTSRWWKR